MTMRFSAKCVLVLALMLALPGMGSAATMRIAFEDREQFPYYVGEGERIDWNRPGISVEIVRKAAAELGIEAVFVRQPWKRCLMSLASGQVDAIFNSSFVRDRLAYGVYPGNDLMPDPSLRIATMSYSLYRRKGSTVSWDNGELLGIDRPVGVVLGYSIIEDLGRMDVALEAVGSSRQNFEKLRMGRLSGAILQTVTGDRLLKTGSFPMIERVDPPIVTKYYYLMMSRSFVHDEPEMAARFWEKIAELRDGMTARLTRKYAE